MMAVMAAHASRRTYFLIFAVLIVLTVGTVLAANFDLGRGNAVVALTIAVTKALLVALFFMHLRDSSRLIWLVAGGSLVWLVLLLLTVGDYLTRNWLPPPPTF